MEGYNYTLTKDPKPIIKVYSYDNTQEENLGVIPRSINYLFDKLESDEVKKKRKYTVYCSFLQIYNEKIYDLLNPIQYAEDSFAYSGLKIRFKKGNFSVENLYKFECKSRKDVYDLFHFGLSNRIVAAHRLNHASSRSHSLLTITLESIDLNNIVF